MSVMMTCGLPRGHGCGRCDTCRNEDGTYGSTPGQRWVQGLLFWIAWLAISATLGAILSLLFGWPYLATAGGTLIAPMVAFFLFVALGPM